MSSSSLKERWYHLFSGFTSSTNRSVDEVWNQITKSYGAPERKYHNLEHLQEMFEEFDRIEEEISQPDAVALAIFFHDVYYDPTGNRNEEESAALAEEILSDFNFDQRLIKEVKSLILASKTGSFPINSDQQFMVDIDRSILGKSPDKYANYRNQIRQEYSLYPEKAFLIGRKHFIRSLLGNASIYLTAPFKERLEKQAIKNLTEELNTIESGH
jgi:predicted metal-dependent HD superfamily phosphohydrolase